MFSIMVKNVKTFQRFQDAFISNADLSIQEKYKILESMYEQARALGHFKGQNALDGLEVDIRIARAVNHVSRPPHKNR